MNIRFNPNHFKAEDSKTKITITNIIKTVFEFGWESKRNFDYNS